VISRTAEYAIRAALWLSANTSQPRTVQQIARATAVPPGYLAKVLQLLGKAGLVRAQPGPGGGFLLAKRADEVALLEVIDAVDPIPRVRECPLGLIEHQLNLCPLHSRLDAALALVQNAFAACTLAELLAESGPNGLFCIESSNGRPEVQQDKHRLEAGATDARGRRAAAALDTDPVSLPPEHEEQAPKGTEP
jgi:Rrf2 family nitric oxide-sensitive transcriptional repressor